MADYVKLDDVIDALERTTWYHQAKNGEMVEGANSELHQPWYKEQDIYDAVQAIPAADVVPVARCKDCRFWNRDKISVEGLARCNTGETGIRYRTENDFCSRGMRMDGDGDV